MANKLDFRPESAQKKFKFSEVHKIPLYFTSAATGVNVVRVFDDILKLSIDFKKRGGSNFVKDVLNIINVNDDSEELFN